MNKKDEYWFWVFEAISAPKRTNCIYYYDKVNDELFALELRANEICPKYRNNYTAQDNSIKLRFERKIANIKKESADFISLPKLTTDEKKIFLKGFIDGVLNDEILKLKLQHELVNFSDMDNFYFKADIKSLNIKEYIRFDMAQGKWLADKVAEIYSPIGITEKTEVCGKG